MVIKKIEHTAMIVNNLEESIKFYETILNFKLRSKGNTELRKMAFIYIEGQPYVEIELIEELSKRESTKSNGVIDHLAFAVDNLDKAIEELKKKGIEFTEQQRVSAFGEKMIFFKGINGELLQLLEK